MISHTRIPLSILALGITTLACSLFAPPLAVPTNEPPPAPIIEPSSIPVPEVPTQLVPTQPPPAPSLPSGLVTAREQSLSFFDLEGRIVSQVELPPFTYPERSRLHLGGTLPAGGGAAPLLYFSFDNVEALHYRDGSGQIFSLRTGTGFLGLTGVPGQPVVAFSEIEYLEFELRSKIYVGSVQTLPSAAPISVIDDPESWAVRPIMVQADQGVPTHVWYTRMAYGIGGDIVFEPRKGLYLLEVATGQISTILTDERSPWAISPDGTWVAFSAAGSQSNAMCLKNLPSGAELCFPALPVVEPRGAGDGFLSPDSQHVAWMEGDGWQMAEVPTFKATVRVGQSDGTLVADLPMSTFEAAAGLGPVSRAMPVGWLDNRTVIVQVRGPEWELAALLGFDVLTRETRYLAPGEFIGLLYP